MRFGPLSTEGGERRLNVLISRAKRRCEVFSGITADDIDLARASGRGVAALKTFLAFAQTGDLHVSQPTGRTEQSPFEAAVRRAIESLGHKVYPQVGIAGFFIDLAVVDPRQAGGYLLGIECDGAAYHSSRSARDRDRLRQAVLEDHGWIMEPPTVPLPPGKYLVTGNRKVTAVLTIHPADKNGDRRWELDQGAKLYDVTHLACRSARYTPATVGGSCSPANVQKTAFPVALGGVMPPVAGCTKQDYAVLIVIGVGVED
jgi:hypothetical protein